MSQLNTNTEGLQSLLEMANALPDPIEIDTSLSQSGMAADAKAVGDAITQLLEAASITLKSSSEGSSKRFKLEIDDNGVLSATEITE